MATSHSLAEGFAQTLTDHHLTAFADLLHADYVNHNRHAQPGKEGSVGISAEFLSAFEDFRVEVDDVYTRRRTHTPGMLGQHHRPARRPADHRARIARLPARVDMSTPRSHNTTPRNRLRVNTYPAI